MESQKLQSVSILLASIFGVNVIDGETKQILIYHITEGGKQVMEKKMCNRTSFLDNVIGERKITEMCACFN